MDESPRRLLTIPEACAVLQMSRATIYRLIQDGDLERVKLRGSAWITEQSLAAYVERCAA